jgi:hypothetical protein
VVPRGRTAPRTLDGPLSIVTLDGTGARITTALL